ncbi:hypothetical protein RB195_013351 [Necator americanus]|uniref:G-protein coupled receptors family 1 profile domain-containing protein n=1 Tax=Necator americanus TaxID=51031 RepID=A0ABR1DVA4_NECAM
MSRFLYTGDPSTHCCLPTKFGVFIFLPPAPRYALVAAAPLVLILTLFSILRPDPTLLVVSLVCTTLLQVPGILVIAKAIIGISSQGEHTTIHCQPYFSSYQCWLYDLESVYLWGAVIFSILSLLFYTFLGTGLQKLRILPTGAVTAVIVNQQPLKMEASKIASEDCVTQKRSANTQTTGDSDEHIALVTDTLFVVSFVRRC